MCFLTLVNVNGQMSNNILTICIGQLRGRDFLFVILICFSSLKQQLFSLLKCIAEYNISENVISSRVAGRWKYKRVVIKFEWCKF